MIALDGLVVLEAVFLRFFDTLGWTSIAPAFVDDELFEELENDSAAMGIDTSILVVFVSGSVLVIFSDVTGMGSCAVASANSFFLIAARSMYFYITI